MTRDPLFPVPFRTLPRATMPWPPFALRLVAAVMLILLAMTGRPMAEGFPVTVPHALGETVIEARPERVLALGRNDQDFLYALGVAPVAVREWWGEQPYATWPWAEDARQALGAEPEVLSTPNANIEWIAAQQPDLILAVYEDINRRQYRALSRIAPVVLWPAEYDAYRAPWQDQLRQTALAVTGGTDAADEIIAALDAKTAAIRAAHPELEGRSGALADYRKGEVVLFASDHAPSRFLAALGLHLPEALEERADRQGWIHVSPEELYLIDLDVVVWPNGNRAAVEDLETYRMLKLHDEGRSIWLPGSTDTLAAALWFQSPLSLDYALDRIVPMLGAALDGDPETQAAPAD